MASQLESVAAESMDNFWSHLEKGHLDASITRLKSLGYAAAAVEFVLTPQSYYFPVHDNASLQRPTRIGDDVIPVVALERTQEYEFERPLLHSLQIEALQLQDVDAKEIDQAMRKLGSSTISSVMSGTNPASVYRTLWPLTKDTRQVESRPTVIFNPDFTQFDSPIACPSAVMHELSHVAQSLSNPLWDGQDRLQKELEAYAVQAQLVNSYALPYTGEMAMAGQVNLQRKRYLGENGYSPSREFIDFARHDDVLRKIIKDE